MRPLVISVATLSLTAAAFGATQPAVALSPPPRSVLPPTSAETRTREALERLLAEHARLPNRASERVELRARIDTMAAQRDAHASGLYWHTDMVSARAEAGASNRPILSLRLLGKLTDDLSCANSRFFRAALYPDAGVNALLKNRFVLHWESERPAPVVTIDFGDGRKVVRTITGNSIHYVLDAQGRPIDAFPGLYGPGAFQLLLKESLALHAKVLAAPDEPARADTIRDHHATRLATLGRAFGKLARAAGLASFTFPSVAEPPPTPRLRPAVRRPPPTAMRAAPIAISKMATEMPILRKTMPIDLDAGASLRQGIDWARLSRMGPVARLSRLGSKARAFIIEKSPRDWSDPRAPRALDRLGVAKLIAAFQRTIAEDTVKNSFTTLLQTSAFFRDDRALSFETLNRRVYGEVFLTPRKDPWLGLLPGGVFTGIENDGLVITR